MSDSATGIDCGSDTPTGFVRYAPGWPLSEPCEAVRSEVGVAQGLLGVPLFLLDD
ncbi:MAG: hypothetical protein ACJATT_005061 [Myxococcota bacterium]|jgi:hypothetical protein